MRILVTGGAGFIGSNYVRRIVDGSLKGVTEVVVLDKLTYAGTLKNLDSIPKDSFRFIQGDICDESLVSRLVAETDLVINFAAESHVDRSITDPGSFIETNVKGTHNLLEATRRAGEKRYLQISTDEVYGTIKEGSWSEDYPLLPNSPYSASKASADLITRSYFRTFGLNSSVTRCSNNYGPNQFPEKVIPLFITNLMDGKKVPLYGDGLNVRDWLHVDDHCRGIHSVLLNGQPGEIYNIGGGEELTNKELTNIILNAFGKGDESIEYVPDRLGHDFRYSVNIKKISSELGYSPQVKFKEGIMETIQWYQENESWWRPLKNK
jgi:dTDP-glucose 4,6-dehydratase